MNEFMRKQYKSETDYIIDNYFDGLEQFNYVDNGYDKCIGIHEINNNGISYDLTVFNSKDETKVELFPNKEAILDGSFSNIMKFGANMSKISFLLLKKQENYFELMDYLYEIKDDLIFSKCDYYLSKSDYKMSSLFKEFYPEPVLNYYKRAISKDIEQVNMRSSYVLRDSLKTVQHKIDNVNNTNQIKIIQEVSDFINRNKYQETVYGDSPIIKIHSDSFGISHKSKVLTKV